MNANTLCSLIAQRIDPRHFHLEGLEVVFCDIYGIFRKDNPDFDTPENRAIVADVIKNYPELAAAYEAKQDILKEISKLEAQQTPRRIREAIKDPTWMNNLEEQIIALRETLRK